MIFNPDNPNEHKEYNDKLREFVKLPTFEKLKRIANKLNDEKLDFKKNQCRCYLSYDYNSKSIMQLVDNSNIRIQGVVYCVKQEFKENCLKYIGKEELEKYLKE